METMIGFIAGYLAGAKDGPAGLARVRRSLEAIRSSPQLRRLTAEAAGIAGSIVRQGARRGLSGTVSELVKMLVPDPEPTRTPTAR
jgi:hypothetical protein